MSWVTVSEAYVLAAMPTELGSQYSAWITTNPDKADRLSDIVRSVVADFRAGLGANPTVVMEASDDTLPERCVQHCLMIVFYHLALEMGVSINMSAQTAFINAEVYMRQLYSSDAIIDRDSVGQTPSYSANTSRAARALTCA